MPNQDSHNISSKLKEEDPHLCSTSPTSTDVKQEERSQPRNTEDFSHYTAVGHGAGKHTGKETTLVPEIRKPGRQENLATPVAENSHSNPVKMLPQSLSSSAQQDYSKDHHERLQLCGCLGEKLSNANLSNHKMWQNISYIRPGWVPDGPPFLPDDQYWELKANSTVVSISIPPCLKDPKQDMVACGVTCYIHDNGPWCEVQNDHGTRVCLLVAGPETPQIPALMQFWSQRVFCKRRNKPWPNVHHAAAQFWILLETNCVFLHVHKLIVVASGCNVQYFCMNIRTNSDVQCHAVSIVFH